jgi:hypothetical protein
MLGPTLQPSENNLGIEYDLIFALWVYLHYHKHQGLGPSIRSPSRVTAALAIVFYVFQLIFFLVA